VEPHISIYFTDIKSFFNLDNLEPAPGRTAPELKVKTLKIGKLDVLDVKIKKKIFHILEIYTDMRFHTKN
jgi:hypothetical protein